MERRQADIRQLTAVTKVADIARSALHPPYALLVLFRALFVLFGR